MDIDPSQNPIQSSLILFKTLILERIKEKSTRKAFHLQFKMFLLQIHKLKKYNENLEHPLYRPSHSENLRETSDYFEVKDIETKMKRQKILTIGYNNIYYK